MVQEPVWAPPPAVPTPASIVYLHVAWSEAAVARQMKQAGGHWRHDCKLWAMRYAQAEQLQLLDRIVDPEVQ